MSSDSFIVRPKDKSIVFVRTQPKYEEPTPYEPLFPLQLPTTTTTTTTDTSVHIVHIVQFIQRVVVVSAAAARFGFHSLARKEEVLG